MTSSALRLPLRSEPALRRLPVLLLLVVLVGLTLGAATSFAQTVLPDALRPFANSASGWTLLTALAVAGCRVRTVPSAVLGAACFVSLVLGYQVVSTLRGFPTSETLFLIVGLVVGPFVGAAAAWLRRGGVRTAVACGALAGIALGEAAYGLLVVAATTGWFFWTLIGVAGLGLVTHTLLRRLRTAGTRLLAVGLVLVTALAFFFNYAAIGGIVA